MKPHKTFMKEKKTNIKYNDYSGLSFKMQLLEAIKKGRNRLWLFNPVTYQARWKTKTVPFRLISDDFDKQRTSQLETQ